MSNIFIISAPSGCGKTSLVRELCECYPFLSQTVSYTTRPIRSGEENGSDYIFISRGQFVAKKKKNEFKLLDTAGIGLKNQHLKKDGLNLKDLLKFKYAIKTFLSNNH